MSKKKNTKYFYDTHTLSYKKVEKNIWNYALKAIGFLSISLIFGFFIYVFASKYFPSPNEKMLMYENQNLEVNLKIIDKHTDQLEKQYKELVNRDNEIYRTLFEANPISEDIRKAGIGGSDRYSKLRRMNKGELVANIREKMDKLSAQFEVQGKSYKEILGLAKNKEKYLSSIPAIMPVKIKNLKRVASGYGYRIDPIYRTSKFHAGMDFTAPRGTHIFTTGDGVVTRVEKRRGGYGYNVTISHGFGYSTLYAHMSKILVKQGQRLKRGHLIGHVGSTGKSTGPHLHYEVRKNKEAVNPANFYFNDLSDQEYEKLLEQASLNAKSLD